MVNCQLIGIRLDMGFLLKGNNIFVFINSFTIHSVFYGINLRKYIKHAKKLFIDD